MSRRELRQAPLFSGRRIQASRSSRASQQTCSRRPPGTTRLPSPRRATADWKRWQTTILPAPAPTRLAATRRASPICIVGQATFASVASSLSATLTMLSGRHAHMPLRSEVPAAVGALAATHRSRSFIGPRRLHARLCDAQMPHNVLSVQDGISVAGDTPTYPSIVTVSSAV